MTHARRLVLLLVLAICAAVNGSAAEVPDVQMRNAAGRVEIAVDGAPVATYVCDDEQVPRPYIAHVHAPGKVQVTRNHPPIEGADATDHATFHPGIWLAFGELGGADYWRNKARVVHDAFLEQPRGGEGHGSFVARHLYLDQKDPQAIICREEFRLDFFVRPAGYLLLWDSIFSNQNREFTFGDQEEMGLGVRLATPLAEKNGGTIRDAAGRTTADAIWGNAAEWCDYSGTIDGRHVGVMLMGHPDNLRQSWWHARDYGLLVANPFGRKAFDQGLESSVLVEKSESLRLRFGLMLHASRIGKPPDLAAAYAEYLDLASRVK